MRLSEVIGMLRGVLKNTPSISAFEEVSSMVEKIRRGWLFLALDSNDITQAITQGAYGIIYQKDIDVPQGFQEPQWQEIAWIEVEDINDALKRLIRYKILFNDIQMVSVNAIEYAIASSIVTDKRVCLIKENMRDLLESLRPEIAYIITDNQDILMLSSSIVSLLKPLNPPFELLSYTLFDVRILYQSKEYLLNLPYLFIDELSALCAMCQNYNIAITMDKFESICFLKPYFIDSVGTICGFGQTQKVVIAQENKKYFESFVQYFDTYARWGERIYAIPKDMSYDIESSGIVLIYENIQELSFSIRHRKYNFLLILGIDEKKLVEILQSYRDLHQPTLFDGLL